MTDLPRTDALVFFGATGDLALKMIFPALQALAKDGRLDIPVIGVAKAGWDLARLRERARESLETYGGGVDGPAFEKLCAVLRYIDGDYGDPKTFDQLREVLGGAKCPLHYLAIPPAMFGQVVGELGGSGCHRGGRVVVEKPFGRDLASARDLNRTLQKRISRVVDLSDRSLPRKRGGAESPLLPFRQCLPRADLESDVRRTRRDHALGIVRSARPRPDVRRHRRDPRRRGESSLAGRGQRGDGLSGSAGRRGRSGRPDRGPPGHRPADAEGRRAGTVRGVHEGARRGSGLARRDVRGGASLDRLPAVDRGPVLHSHRKVPAGDVHRGDRDVQGDEPARLRRGPRGIELRSIPSRPRDRTSPSARARKSRARRWSAGTPSSSRPSRARRR